MLIKVLLICLYAGMLSSRAVPDHVHVTIGDLNTSAVNEDATFNELREFVLVWLYYVCLRVE